jgi:hypothetical protein
LDGNSIRDLSPLAGIEVIDGDDAGGDDVGYAEATGDWQSELVADPNSWQGNYRLSKDGGSASWTFNVDAGTEVDLFATWPVFSIDNPQDVTFTISGIEGGDVTIPVLHTLPPGAAESLAGDDVIFGGVPWESLGKVIADGETITVTLTGVDGQTLSADAVRLQPVTTPALSLRSLSLLGNPVNDHSRNEVLPTVLAVNPDLQVFLSEPGAFPVSQPLPPITAGHRSLSNPALSLQPLEVSNQGLVVGQDQDEVKRSRRSGGRHLFETFLI